MFDFVKAFEWLSRAFSSFFQYKSVKTYHQSETDIIKSKIRLEKSYTYYKQIIFECISLLYSYRSCLSKKDRRKLSKIIKKIKDFK